MNYLIAAILVYLDIGLIIVSYMLLYDKFTKDTLKWNYLSNRFYNYNMAKKIVCICLLIVVTPFAAIISIPTLIKIIIEIQKIKKRGK